MLDKSSHCITKAQGYIMFCRKELVGIGKEINDIHMNQRILFLIDTLKKVEKELEKSFKKP